MANGLLGAIINPAQTDVLGALDKGRERQATDLAGELLGQTIGGKVGQLARLSPEKALAFAQATGTPLTSEGRIKNLMGINIMGAKLFQAGQTQEALQFISDEADKIESATGEPATTLRTFLAAASQGNQEAIDNFVRVGTLFDPTNQQGKDFTLSEGQQRFDAAGNVVATGQPKTQAGRDTLSQVQSSQILPDGSTVQVFKDGSTRVTGKQGRILTGLARQEAVEAAQEFGIEVQSRRAGGRTVATEEGKRNSALIVRGIAAAESTAVIRRALTLLDRVKTGGIAAISLATKQRLGIEGADEGELSNSLGKAVLSQLRETFGAAFTESEGLRLERIEAGFGKSAATNRRLLGQALRIAENTAKRASKVSSEGEAADIEDLLSFSLDIDDLAKPLKQQNLNASAQQVDLSTLSDEELLQLRNQPR